MSPEWHLKLFLSTEIDRLDVMGKMKKKLGFEGLRAAGAPWKCELGWEFCWSSITVGVLIEEKYIIYFKL